MRLIANYEPLAGVAVGDEQMLWGTLCTIANTGTEDSPRLLYVTDVAEKAEGEAMVASGRFQAADEPKASKAKGKADE